VTALTGASAKRPGPLLMDKPPEYSATAPSKARAGERRYRTCGGLEIPPG